MTSKTKKFFLTILLADITLVLIYGALLYSTDQKQQKTAALYALSHRYESDRDKTKGLGQSLKDTKESRAKLDASFISKSDTVTFIEQIEKVGKIAGVLLSVNAVTDAPKGTFGIQLDFSATGGFSNLYRLMVLVESLPYKISLNKADIQKVKTDDASEQWSGNFTIILASFLAADSPDNAPTRDETVKNE